jgi:hypothetical protein
MTYVKYSDEGVKFTDKTLYGTTQEILFKDKKIKEEKAQCLIINFPCHISILSRKPRSFTKIKIESDVSNKLNLFETNIIKTFKKNKKNKKLSHIKPFVFIENNEYFILSILSGSRENMFCKVKKYEDSCELPLKEWLQSFDGFVKLRILGITIKESSFYLVNDIVELLIEKTPCMKLIESIKKLSLFLDNLKIFSKPETLPKPILKTIPKPIPKTTDIKFIPSPPNSYFKGVWIPSYIQVNSFSDLEYLIKRSKNYREREKSIITRFLGLSQPFVMFQNY